MAKEPPNHTQRAEHVFYNVWVPGQRSVSVCIASNAEPQRIQAAVAEYLEEQLGCAVRRHRLGFELVTVTGRTRANVGAFLAAVKLFYTVMRELGCSASENPPLWTLQRAG